MVKSSTVYKPEDDAFAADFVEFSDSWSRAEVRAAWAALPTTATGEDAHVAEERLLAVLRPKIVALHLSCVGAEPITDPADLVPARTDQMDTRLYSWFGGLWVAHLNQLAELGNALGRKLYDTSGKQETKPTKPTATARSRSRRK